MNKPNTYKGFGSDISFFIQRISSGEISSSGEIKNEISLLNPL